MIGLEIKQKLVERSVFALWWLIVGGAALWLLVGSVAYWVKNGWLPADTAGWVQAIGGIAAIVGAFVVSRLEGNRQRNEKVQGQMTLMHQSYTRAAYVVACLDTHRRAFNGQVHAPTSVAVLTLKLLRTAQLDMEAIGHADLGDFDVIYHWSNLKRSVRLIIATLEEAEGGRFDLGQAETWYESASGDLGELESAVEAFGKRFSRILTGAA